MPGYTPEILRQRSEDLSRFPGTQNVPCYRREKKTQDPSDDNTVSNGNPKGADDWNQPHQASKTRCISLRESFFESAQRPGLHCAPESHLTNHAGQADQHNKQDIRN